MQGDFHNFSQQVFKISDQWFYKPRCLFWEWLFLSLESPLRQTLKALFDPFPFDPFRYSPDVRFLWTDLTQEAFMEKLTVSPFDESALPSDFIQGLGSFCALAAWFGMGDLHQENLLFGKNPLGQLVFYPIDLENIFADFSHLNQTGLLPARSVSEQLAGLSLLLPSLKQQEPRHFLCAFIDAFLGTTALLNQSNLTLSKIISSLPQTFQAPIRVVLRPTADYKRFLKQPFDMSFSTPLLPSEWLQLQRGDVPYYFRYLHQPTLYYFEALGRPTPLGQEEALFTFNLPPQLLLKSEGSFVHSQQKNLKKSGLLQIAKYLLKGHPPFHFKEKELEVTKTQGWLCIQFKEEYKIKCLL